LSIFKTFKLAKKIQNDPLWNAECAKGNHALENRNPSRTDVINFLIQERDNPRYLEIGTRNPDNNFNHIKAIEKFSVDPGIEFSDNPVDFPMTSDEFFKLIDEDPSKIDDQLFDIIFIDGLHRAQQAYRDILNALRWIKPDGFVVVHDCNPPTEWHQRTDFNFKHTPAGIRWNGTTWKAFVKARQIKNIMSCCIDSDWGIGVLCVHKNIGKATTAIDQFMDYDDFDRSRKALLNLVTYDEFKENLK